MPEQPVRRLVASRLAHLLGEYRPVFDPMAVAVDDRMGEPRTDLFGMPLFARAHALSSTQVIAHCAAISGQVPAQDCLSRGAMRAGINRSDTKPEAAAEKIEHVAGAAIREGVADVVRRALIDPHLDIRDVLLERLVIGGRADGLGAGYDDEGRALDPVQLVAPVVARHQ